MSVEYWVRQLRQTVRFGQGIGELLEDGQRIFLEAGPGQALARLVKTNAQNMPAPATINSMPGAAGEEVEGACLLKAVGRLWLSGAPFDWESLHVQEDCRRVPLPTYPFEKERYWIDPNPVRELHSRPAASGKNSSVADWFHLPSWRRSLLVQEQQGSGLQQWILLSDSHGLASALQQHLQAEGHNVVVVHNGKEFQQNSEHEFTMDIARRDHYRELLKTVSSASMYKIVHLWSLTPEDLPEHSVDLFKYLQVRGYYSLLSLSQALAEASVKADVLVVTDRLNQIDSIDAPYPEKQPMLAICQVVPQEMPAIRFRSVELDSSWMADSLQVIAGRILDEAKSASSELLVAYRRDRRLVRSFDPVKLDANSKTLRKLKQKAIYVITGGFGGVGIHIAEHLARTFSARLVLISRTPIPPRETWPEQRKNNPDDVVSVRIRQIQELETLGGEVMVVSPDLTNAEQMKSAFDAVEQTFGKIDGIFHTAGVTTGDSLFRSFTELGASESEIQFGPKVYGVYALQEALRGRNPDFCLLFSSNAAILGGLGYLTYVAANLFMDAAAQTSRNQTSWISADWDPWPKEIKRFKEIKTSVDQYAMTVEESLEALTKTIEHIPSGQVVVATGDLEKRLNIWIHEAHDSNTPEASFTRPDLKVEYVPPADHMEEAIAVIWQRILGIERVGRNDNFFDLGGHSLLATRLISQLRDEFQCEVPINKFFETPTIGEVADLIRTKKLGQEEEDRSAILDMLAELSDEEVTLELQKRATV